MYNELQFNNVQWENICVFLFSVIFLSLIAYAALQDRSFTDRQYELLRILCAIAAAGVASFIPGSLNVNLSPGTRLVISAGGAIAVFIIIYFFSPPPPPGASR